jgi:hypothetical protein
MNNLVQKQRARTNTSPKAKEGLTMSEQHMSSTDSRRQQHHNGESFFANSREDREALKNAVNRFAHLVERAESFRKSGSGSDEIPPEIHALRDSLFDAQLSEAQRQLQQITATGAPLSPCRSVAWCMEVLADAAASYLNRSGIQEIICAQLIEGEQIELCMEAFDKEEHRAEAERAARSDFDSWKGGV